MKTEVFTIVSMVLTAVVLFVNNIFAVELPLWLFIVNIALGLCYLYTVVAFIIIEYPRWRRIKALRRRVKQIALEEMRSIARKNMREGDK